MYIHNIEPRCHFTVPYLVILQYFFKYLISINIVVHQQGSTITAIYFLLAQDNLLAPPPKVYIIDIN